MVAEGCLYASGQLSMVAYLNLRAAGMRTIVCLRAERFRVTDPQRWRPEKGMYWFPVPRGQAPAWGQAEAFLRLAGEGDRWPLLVHCHHGDGRAATLAALVRYALDGWEMEHCLREVARFRRFRLLVLLGLRPRLGGAQEAFLHRWERDHPPGSHRPTRVRNWNGLRFEGDARHRTEMQRLWDALPARVPRVPVTVFEKPAAEWDLSVSSGYYLYGEIHLREDLWNEHTFYHEYGHVVWYEAMNGAQRADWERFWARNLKEMPRDYARKSALEGHAECFAQACLPSPNRYYRPITSAIRGRVLSYFPSGE